MATRVNCTCIAIGTVSSLIAVHMLLSLRLSLFSLQCGPPKRVGRYEAAVASVIDDSTDRRRRRWETAAAMLEATTAERRRFDHRAHLARIVGVYVSETVPGASSSDTELLVAMQPDQGGRKMLFLSPANGRILGFIELETLTAHSNNMLPDDEPARNGEEAHGTIALRGIPNRKCAPARHIANMAHGRS